MGVFDTLPERILQFPHGNKVVVLIDYFTLHLCAVGGNSWKKAVFNASQTTRKNAQLDSKCGCRVLFPNQNEHLHQCSSFQNLEYKYNINDLSPQNPVLTTIRRSFSSILRTCYSVERMLPLSTPRTVKNTKVLCKPDDLHFEYAIIHNS